ncbi:MAG: hypothetical protein IT257_03340, partial [Chitinophagaceae bacterium]|nr:hypothetical protein [Chitinophagaceae bacterium]
MKRIFTTLLLIVSFIFRSQSQVIDNACEGIPCNSLPICGVNTIANVNSYTASLAPFNVNPGGIGNCNNAVGGVVNYTATPNWIYYRLKCYAGGVLNFSINPNDPAADMDWAIWDISVSGCGSLTAGNLLECNSFAGAGATGLQPAPAAGFETGITLTAG